MLAAFDDDGAGPGPAGLFVAGDLTTIAGLSSERIARYGPAAIVPIVEGQPIDRRVAPGEPASFSVGASGSYLMTYQWFHNGEPLTDDGAMSGCTTLTLSIGSADSSHAGTYWVSVSDECGTSSSQQAYLAVCPMPADGDMNGDSLVDGNDIQPFVTAMMLPYFSGDFVCKGDFDGVNRVDAQDVGTFVNLLLSN